MAGHQRPVLPIITDPSNRRLGVFIPVGEWAKLQAGVNPRSPIYIIMARLATKPLHECTVQELAEIAEEKLRSVEMQHLEEGRYVIERDRRYPDTNIFVHRYADHRELVSTDKASGITTVISSNLD